MARLPYLTKDDLPPEHQDVLKRDIALYRILANSPGMARAFSGLGMHIRHGSKLDPRLRQLAILQIGWLARAAYEWSHHVKISRQFGVPDQDIGAVASETDGKQTHLEPLARLVLQGAREMWRGPGMAPATFDALRDALGNEQVTDLTVTIAFYCGVVRVLMTLEIDVEPEYESALRDFPLPA